MKRKRHNALIAAILFLMPALGFGQSVNLGSASSFALFTAAGAFSNSGAATFVTGDVGTNVGAFSAFPPGILVGQIHVADPASAQAAADVKLAYGSISAITCGRVISTTLGGGQSLLPNVYCLGAASTINGDLTLDGQGNPNSIFIFLINGALSTTVGSRVLLTNSASSCNVYWQVNGEVDLGENSLFQGTILADGAINLLEAASLNGRALSEAGAISLHDNVVTLTTQPVAPVITADGATTFCAGDSVVLSGNNGGTWNNGATTSSITVTKSGDYFVTITNGCGSDTSNHIKVTVNPLPIASVISANGPTTFCAGDSVTLSGNNGGTWNNGATSSSITVSAGGDYFVTNTNACGSVTSNHIIVTVNPLPIVMCSHTDVTTKGGDDGTASVTASGGSGSFTYLWSNGATTSSISGLIAGTYTVTVTDADGCSASCSTTVGQPSCDISISGTQSNITCNGAADGSINITVTGAQGTVSYLWNDGATTEDRSGLSAGTYTVTATDAAKCSATASFTISQPKALSLSETHVNVTSCGADNGSITLTVKGGTKPYTYLWSNGQTTQNISGLAVGTYTVTVTDAHGCTAVLSVTITQSSCVCVAPTNITFSTINRHRVQMCWNSECCALGYLIKWELSTRNKWQYRTVNAPDTCTTFTFLAGQSDQIYLATICSNGDTSAFSQLYTYPPPSRVEGDIKPTPEFAVFPNPTSGHMTIVLKNENFTDQPVTIQLVNSFGQVIESDKSELVNGNMTKSMELSDRLAAGIYMVNVIIGTREWHQQIIYAGK